MWSSQKNCEFKIETKRSDTVTRFCLKSYNWIQRHSCGVFTSFSQFTSICYLYLTCLQILSCVPMWAELVRVLKLTQLWLRGKGRSFDNVEMFWTLFYHWIIDISLCIGWMFPITMTGLILVCFKSWIIANSEHGILALYSHVCPYVRMCSSVTFLFLFFQTLSSRNLSHGFQCPPSMSPMPASQLIPLPSQLVPQWTGSYRRPV